MSQKQVIGEPLVIGGRRLSRSRAIRAGDFVYLTGQVPMRDGAVMTSGTIEEQTRAVLDDITATLDLAGCTRADVVKAMVWLVDRADFPGFNAVYCEYFPESDELVLSGDADRFTNHSGDPNTVVEGVNAPTAFVVAARDIAAGEEITCDYAEIRSLKWPVLTAAVA